MSRLILVPYRFAIFASASHTVLNIEQSYEEFGLERALDDDSRLGTTIKFDDRKKSHIVATVCSDPPDALTVGLWI